MSTNLIIKGIKIIYFMAYTFNSYVKYIHHVPAWCTAKWAELCAISQCPICIASKDYNIMKEWLMNEVMDS